jgi:hypothetical protein
LEDTDSNWVKNEEGHSVLWNDIKIWQVRKESPEKFFYKTSYDQDEFNTINVCHKGRMRRRQGNQDLSELIPSQILHGPRPISSAKHRDLLELCHKLAVPKEYHQFYNSLKIATADSDDSDE